MFEIGWSELLVIAVVAIVVIGPKELPGVLRGLGRTLNKLRRSADDFRRQFEDSVRETGFEDIQRDLRSVSDMNPATQIRNSINDAFGTPASTSHLSPSAFDAQLEATPSLPASTPAVEAPNAPAPEAAAPHTTANDAASNGAAQPTEEKPELPRAHAASA